MQNSKTFICLQNYFKGPDFLIYLKSLRNKEYLITGEKRRDKPWPNDYIDETFYMKSKGIDWNLEHLLLGVGTLMKSNQGDAIVALDDYDIKKAIYLRKNVRIDGDGIQTTWRYCRDKLAINM